ncbi:polysaccharide biosynthesis/export family protein [Mucilaginibacter aquaedulcis]|uniref:polysaccharide biosynthesis/export family protein n=1 Tax=Mucilaginibacter aquaedulcis TaxID=1187081 RepID=UPI0025B356D9|nr:polysaccharide biosynthesis/export family protein [Mucilaginibacter aquaedulcis]MDN3549574.1 polysaccharide biosynthesis/export family protein [Mucilaginibacter aquaedulcis]
MNNKILTRSCILLILAMSACAPRRDLVYFSNMANATKVTNLKDQEVHIRENDIVDITMNSLSPESNNLFTTNKPIAGSTSKRNGYQVKVNKDSSVYLPLIGYFKIGGLTIDKAEEGITTALKKNVKNPEVDIQIVNFKITVIGEVNKPSTFVMDDTNVNLLEALGMAGDMTVYGKRENVLVIRNEDGQKTMARLNLNDKESMNSPYFYLKQNDIVYVEPDRAKAVEYSSNTRVIPIVVASISAIAVLAAVLLRR